jgi:hypothetical protein
MGSFHFLSRYHRDNLLNLPCKFDRLKKFVQIHAVIAVNATVKTRRAVRKIWPGGINLF